MSSLLRPSRRAALAALVMVSMAVLSMGRVDSSHAQEKPAFPAHGEIRFDLPTLTDSNRSATMTLDSPVGPITLSAKRSVPVLAASSASGGEFGTLSVHQNRCETWYTLQAQAAFGIANDFRYDYSSVVWMGYVSHDDWAIWPNDVVDQETWTTWWEGIEYAFADGQADLNYGWPVSMQIGTFHLYIQEDAWGNCTPHGWYTF